MLRLGSPFVGVAVFVAVSTAVDVVEDEDVVLDRLELVVLVAVMVAVMYDMNSDGVRAPE